MESQLSIYLLAFGCLMIASLLIERYALKLKIQGALLLFVAGLLINIGSYRALLADLDDCHQLGIGLLLFYAGLQVGSAVSHSKRQLRSELLQVALVTTLSLFFGTVVLGFCFGAGFFGFVNVRSPWLLGFVASYIFAVLDWGAISFLLKRSQLGPDPTAVSRLFQYEASFGAALLMIIGSFVIQTYKSSQDHMAHFLATGLLHAPVMIAGLSIIVGILLAKLLMMSVITLRLERAEVTVATIGFIFFGYGLMHSAFHITGGLTDLVMGSYFALMMNDAYRHRSKDHDLPASNGSSLEQHIALQLQSINIATEAAMIFMVGLSINLEQLAATIPVGLFIALLLNVVRVPAAVVAHVATTRIADQSCASMTRQELLMWIVSSPKGVIGLALISCMPAVMREDVLDVKQLFNLYDYQIVDAICVAILFTMVIQALLLPRFYRTISAQSAA